MKSMSRFKFGAIAAVLLLAGSLANLLIPVPKTHAQSAQPATVVQQTATRSDAATAVASTQGAVNTNATTTIAAQGSNYIYITDIDFSVCTNGTGSAANQNTFTTTNIAGTPSWQFSIAATASICQHWNVPFPNGLKSAQPGVAVTIVPPAIQTNNSYGVNVSYYYGQ